MLITIIKKELLENLLSFRFAVMLLLCMLLVPLSIYVGYRGYQDHRNDYEGLYRTYRQEIKTISVMDILQRNNDLKGFRPPSSFSAFAKGLEEAMPRYFTVTEAGPQAQGITLFKGSILSVFGDMDFLFVVRVVFSLIAFIFAFDAIAGEKELGTLRAVLANAVPRDTVLIGKFIGGYLTIAVPFILSALLGVILLFFFPIELFSGDRAFRLLLILLTALLYIVVFYALGLLISARASKANTALTILLLIWIALTLVYPKLSGLLPRIFYPIQSESALMLEKSLVRQQLTNEKNKRLNDVSAEIFGDRDWRRAYMNMSKEERRAISIKRGQAQRPIQEEFKVKMEKAIGKIEERYQRKRRMQERMGVAMSLLSPSSALSYAMVDLCGTGDAARTSFLAAVNEYQSMIEREVFSYFIRGPTGGGFRGEIDIQSLPDFSFSFPGLREVFGNIWFDVLLLFLFGMLFFLGAYVSFLRCDVT